jgi:hypothetical protein
MRVLVESYGDIKIFSDRPFGYKRYHVQWEDGTESMFSGLWYSESKVIKLVEKHIQDKGI